MIGRTELDLTRLETEETLQMSLSLRGEESGAQPVCDLSLVLWVTGINGPGNSREPGDAAEEQRKQRKDNIGHLTVRVLQATGLGSSRLQGGGFSENDDQNEIDNFLPGAANPFCQLECENHFFRTNTEIKNTNPCWDRTFSFPVRDAFGVLKISVFRKENKSEKIFYKVR